MSKALAERNLDIHGTLKTLAEQKQCLFDAYIIRWKLNINDSYTMKDEGVKQLLQQKLECAVGTLMDVWKSSKVPQNGPRNVAGRDSGLPGVSSGASERPDNFPPSSRDNQDDPCPSRVIHSLRAGETVFYHDPVFNCDPRGRRITKILAIRKLGPNGDGGEGGVRVPRQPETGETMGTTLYMEVVFADGASIDEDHGVQRFRDCNGVQLVPTCPMVELKDYLLVPSVVPAAPSTTAQKTVTFSFLPPHTASPADGGATKDDDSDVQAPSRECAPGSRSVLPSSTQRARRRAPHARAPPTKKRRKIQSVSPYNLYYGENYGRILQEVLLKDQFKMRTNEQSMNRKKRRKRAMKAAKTMVANKWNAIKKIATNVAKSNGDQPTSPEYLEMLATYNRILGDAKRKTEAKLLAAKNAVTDPSSGLSNNPRIPSDKVIASHLDPSPSENPASVIADVNFNSDITQAYGVPIKGNSKDTRQLYWSEPVNRRGTTPDEWAAIARRNVLTLLSHLMEDQPTQSFAVVAADAGLIKKKVCVYDTKEDRILRFRWAAGSMSLKELRLKDESPERYVVLPLLPPNKNLAAHVTIMNETTGVKLSGSAAPTRKEWNDAPWEGWKLRPTRDTRRQAFEEGSRFAAVPCNGVPRKDASKKRICPNWQKKAHCLEFAILAHLCAACLRKLHLEVAPSSYGGLGVFSIELDSKEIKISDFICRYVVSKDFHHDSTAWHALVGDAVKNHAFTFKGKGKNKQVHDAEDLASGLGGRINAADTPEGHNCEYVKGRAHIDIQATKGLGGPHRDARAELLVNSYGEGDFLHPKGSPWRLWRFTGIILEWLKLTTRSAKFLTSFEADNIGVATPATSLQSRRRAEHKRIVKVV